MPSQARKAHARRGSASTHETLRRPREDVELLMRAFGGRGVCVETMNSLEAAARLFECPPGLLEIESPSEPVPAWWLVRAGTVATGEFSASGEFVERDRHRRGQWLDTAGALSGDGTWVRTPMCLSPVELLAIPVQDLAAACARDPAFALEFGRVLATQVRDLRQDLSQWAQADVVARVARWLLRQAELHHALRSGSSWTMDMRKLDMANHLGTTAESISRTLRRLARDGYIRMRGYTITMVNVDGLQALATAWIRCMPLRPGARAAGL